MNREKGWGGGVVFDMDLFLQLVYLIWEDYELPISNIFWGLIIRLVLCHHLMIKIKTSIGKKVKKS